MAASIPRGYDRGKPLVKKCPSNFGGPAAKRSMGGLNGCLKVPLPRRCGSVDFLVRPHGLQENGLSSFVHNELKDDSQVVACAAGPTPFKLRLEFVRLKSRMKAVRGEQVQGFPEVRSPLPVFFENGFRSAGEGFRG